MDLPQFNERFLDVYRRDQAIARRSLGHAVAVVLRVEDDLVLHHQGDRAVFGVVDADYHALKAWCHVPLTAWLTMTTEGAEAGQAQDLIDAVGALPGLDGEGQRGAEAIRAATVAMLEATRAAGCLTHDAATTFGQAVRVASTQLIEHAARLEVARLAEAVARCEARVDPAAWRQAWFVVCAAHQPRYKELSTQFFRRYLAQVSAQGARYEHALIYAEGQGEDGGLDLVAQRIVDGQLGRTFLDSPLDLDQDVLGDAAAPAIDAHFG